MIKIKQSKTADSRTCDWSKVTKEQLLESSIQHIGDIHKGFDFFINLMNRQKYIHVVNFTYCQFINGTKVEASEYKFEQTKGQSEGDA